MVAFVASLVNKVALFREGAPVLRFQEREPFTAKSFLTGFQTLISRE